MSNALIKQLQEKRLRAWELTKSINEDSIKEGRDGTFTAEEEGAWQKANADLNSLDSRLKELIEAENRSTATNEWFEKNVVPEDREIPGAKDTAADKMADEIRSFLKGEKRAMEVTADRPMGTNEFRTLSKLTAAAGQNTVKTSFYEQLIAHLIEVSGIMMAGPTVLNTTTGEQIQVPKTTAHSTGALFAEAATITNSDPTFGQVPLDAFKYAVLIQVSNELINDTSVDLLGYLAMQCGRAVGNAFGTHAITGTGTAQPNGIVTAATLGVTGAAAVSGAFTADNLIDLYFSVIAPYRNSTSCAWMMKDATLANLRKLKDTTNQYLWQPSVQLGQPDTLLGKPIYTDPNVAAVALSAKSVVFGDISQYFVRMVNGVRFDRSDDFAFSSDLVTFRCTLRADGDLVDTTGAVKYFQGNAA